MCAALDDLGHELHLFGKADKTGVWHSLPLQGGVRHSIVPRTLAFVTATLAAAARYRPGHVICTHVNFAPVAHAARRILGVPYTVVAHGVDINPGLPRWTLAALRAADRIIAVSSWTRQRVLDIGGIDESQVTVLANTFDESRFTVAPRPAELVERYRIRSGEKVVLTVARLDAGERYKGHDRIIQVLGDVIAECGSVRFIIVGNGKDKARVEALAQGLGVTKAVTFAGFVPDDELADHYRLADAFAMPSTGEGFGIVFLEAMACGTPVLGGNRDGSADALDNGRLGMLVDPTDAGAIAAGLSALLRKNGPPLWFDREALRSAVVARFGRNAFRARLEEALPF